MPADWRLWGLALVLVGLTQTSFWLLGLASVAGFLLAWHCLHGMQVHTYVI